MKTFPLIISSPNGDLFKDQAVRIKARGVEGEFAILAGHVPFVTVVKECDCDIELEDGTVKTGHTKGGLMNVAKDKVTFLSGTFTWK